MVAWLFYWGKGGQPVTAPIAPGVVETVSVETVQLMAPGEAVEIIFNPVCWRWMVNAK
jgi:hypothetical protein